MAAIFISPFTPALNTTGVTAAIASGAKLYFYVPGTLTPKDVFTDAALSVPHANPVVANAAGTFAAIYFGATEFYRVFLKTSADVTLAEAASYSAASGSLVDATQTVAGLMPAQDKKRLDELPAVRHALLASSGSHAGGKVAGTYGMGHGGPLAVSGTGTLYPLNVINIAAADYPAVGTLVASLRIRAVVNVNDVAPGCNFVIGLHPVTRPAVSGGPGLLIYTIGAAAVGSTATFTAPAADSSATVVSADFALPADGQYIIAVVTSATTGADSLTHISAMLQMKYA